MTDAHFALSQHVIRRLKHATSLKGKLKCSFYPDTSLNVTDLTQPFTMYCETLSNGGLVDWWSRLNDWWKAPIVLGIIFGVCAIGYVVVMGCFMISWGRERKKRSAAELAQAEQEAEEAARGDYCLTVDPSESKTSTATTTGS